MMYLMKHPVCVDPFGVHAAEGVTVAASEVDHITPRRAGGLDEEENLQALCKPCHSRKTRAEQGVGG